MASTIVPNTSCSTMISLKPNFQAACGFKMSSRKCNCFTSFKSNTKHQITKPKLVLCVMDMTAGGSESDQPKKLNVEGVINKARKVWESAPEPVKNFPWNRAFDNFIQLILDLVLTVVKYLSIPVLAVTTVSEMSYCAHERKLYLIIFPLLFGVAVAGALKDAALESSPSLKNADVPWHLFAVAVFFTLLKLPGPYYPYWGRIFIPHFANGVLLRTLWFAIMWARRPNKSSETTSSSSGVGSPQ